MSDVRSTALSSGPPWHLEITVEQIGADLLCRLTGGAAHVGAVAVARGREDTAETEVVVVPGHREGELAVSAASALSHAAGTTVACIAGIHFDGVSKDEIGEIVDTAEGLIRRAVDLLTAAGGHGGNVAT